MINCKHFLDYIIRPTIIPFRMGGKPAEVLLLGTALKESHLTYLKQLGGGPAMGPYQMEPFTDIDIWETYLRYRPELKRKVADLLIPTMARKDQLQGNLYYATIMARLKYRRVRQALPLANDLEGMAQYHKDHYNTSAGKTVAKKSIPFFKTAYDTVLLR